MPAHASGAAPPRRILVLGGTAQGREIAQELASRTEVTLWYALAGRTRKPQVDGIPPDCILTGGMGGTDGLARFLEDKQVNALVDATHPFARTISENACAAAARAAVAMARLDRVPWLPTAGDRWHCVDSTRAAINFVLHPTTAPGYRNVLLTVGAAELPAWCEALGSEPRGSQAPHSEAPRSAVNDVGTDVPTVFARSIEAPACELPANFVSIRARGPFTLAAESQLIGANDIDIVVSKLSGGSRSYTKVAAARKHSVPMVMIRPPPLPATRSLDSVAEMIRWATGSL